jgi:hypothetical protein
MAAAVCVWLAGARGVEAGALIVHNLSTSVATCTVDGYDRGNPTPSYPIQPGAILNLPIPADSTMIDYVSCGPNLRTRGMHITPQGPDGAIYLNGQQTRTLSVLLYAFIPTDPTVGYTKLLQMLTLMYQQQNPSVLLNLVLNPDIKTYDFATLSQLMGPTGYDVAELDTVFLTYLVSNQLIAPVTITGDTPIPVAKTMASIGDVLYGVPSWLCSDFVFSFNPKLSAVTTLGQLQALLTPAPANGVSLVADFNGSWTIPAMYLQAVAQNGSSPTPDINPAIIQMMTTAAALCNNGTSNECINGVYHGARNGTIERVFAFNGANGDVGFSERSFYIAYYQEKPQPLTLIPFPWGSGPRIVYSDAFVTNKATCGADPCQSDSATFTAWATSASTKAYIAFSIDLPVGDPPRHLLAATQAFWTLPAVKNDPIYQQVSSTLFAGTMVPYLNNFTPQSQSGLLSELCPALIKASSSWVCKIPPPPPASDKR